LSDKNCSYSSFVITCWFKFLFGKDINNNLIEINDPNKKTLLDIINNKNNIDQIIENFLNYKFVFDINKKDKFFLKKNIKTHLNNINNYGLKNSIININNSKL
jgi:mannitol-1-phosphate/altronate dehydrogenase